MAGLFFQFYLALAPAQKKGKKRAQTAAGEAERRPRGAAPGVPRPPIVLYFLGALRGLEGKGEGRGYGAFFFFYFLEIAFWVNVGRATDRRLPMSLRYPAQDAAVIWSRGATDRTDEWHRILSLVSGIGFGAM